MGRVLVTGINGFVGRHLTRELVNQGHQVDGLIHEGELAPELLELVTNCLVYDLTDRKAFDQVDLSPYDAIINLAGLASFSKSFNNSSLYMEVNANAVGNICRRMLDQGLDSRILAISSGIIYEPKQLQPFTEKSAIAHQGSPYTQSKLRMEHIVLSYIHKGLNGVIVRPFNHIGPGQHLGFLAEDLCKQLLEVAGNKRTSIVVGNLTTKRDYSDVRDVAKAYSLLAFTKSQNLGSHIYNVCSGISRSGQSILEELQRQIPGSENAIIKLNSELMRPTDPLELRGSSKLINKDVGWKPIIPFKQTIQDIVRSVK